MKKNMIAKMMALTTTLALSSAFGAGAKSTQEMLADYSRQAREHVYGKAASAKNLSDSALIQIRETLLKQGEISSLAGRLRSALSGKAGADRMDSLVTIVAAKKMSVEIAKKDSVEAQSIDAAANASAKLISNADTVGAKNSTDLTAAEANLVVSALQKAESLPSRILTQFSRAERDSYASVIERYDLLNSTSTKKSAEDNFVQAIMDVKKVDKAKALEVVKKLKECV